MISLRVLSAAAALALVLPLAAPSASYAQHPPGARGGGGVHVGGGGGGPRFSSGGGRPAFSGGGGGAVHYGGGGGGYGGGGYRRGGNGFIPGAVAGAIIGGAIAGAPYGYGYGPGYYAPGYYDDQYYDQGPVVVAPAPTGDDDSVAWCMQTYRSYDPRSGTYVGYDGYRHPCP
jgi:hypothetical protein